MKEDILLMSGKERLRKAIIEAVKNGHFTMVEAAERLDITERQVRRILRRYEKEGDKGLIHRHRGKVSNHTCDFEFKTVVLELYRTKFLGFGPTFASEKLAEEGYAVLPETLRLWLKAEGLWQNKRTRSSYRKQRKRSEKFGDMLQLDGSFHHWFGEDYPTACLMNLVDDATGTTMALIDKEETTEAAMRLLRRWIVRYGVPKSIYVDLKTVYVSPKTLKLNEELDGLTAAFTHFSKACAKLGIKIIKAYSPQAKGRVERKHAVFQDRFVKELQLKNIKTIARANHFLANIFLDHINNKFAKHPIDPQNGHRETKSFGDLNQIFCWEYTRQIQNDWTIRFKGKYYQINKTSHKVKSKQKVTVRQHLDETISLWYENIKLVFEELQYQPQAKIPIKKGHDLAAMSERSRLNKHLSPWNRFNPGWLKSDKILDNKLCKNL